MDNEKFPNEAMRVNSLLYYDTRSSTQITVPNSSLHHTDAPIQLISSNGSTYLGLPLEDSIVVPRNIARIQDNYLVSYVWSRRPKFDLRAVFNDRFSPMISRTTRSQTNVFGPLNYFL